ncbi:Phage T7 exclusion protein [Candidatus Burkholderia verschuerenii]|uniref:Phage T7 exclusion protein n=1 Tax=Candidatus Burkholderia verschuerenii TaxID=242163 RepID=A0A0L0M4R7_9BURK|nr:P-loop NTPase fold protein [Candidatus Burkholderia verschuerenii]KND57286.1 Phage T7 exclusion protein [Candidatus Burkholderia verschuerenii]
MWSDVETQDDYLNYLEVAEVVSEILLSPAMRPVSVGVFGTWGTGKSSLLNLIEADLERRAKKDVIVIRFDAWLYQGFDDARAALMDVIARKLYDEAKEDAGAKGLALKLLARVDVVRSLGLAVEIGAAAFGVPTFGVGSRVVGAIGNYLSGTPEEEDAKAIAEGKKELGGLIKPEKKQTPPEQIDAFRADFGQLLTDLGKTLVVFVDNLDRCLPGQTIHTLEAVRLFLFMGNSAFVVAADEDMVRHSVSQHFKDADSRHVKDYLDKLIQVPVRVPRLGVAEIRGYLFMLFANGGEIDKADVEKLRARLETNLRLSWKEPPLSIDDVVAVLGDKGKALRNSFDVADRIAALLANAPLVDGNPRIVKRMLNVVRLRSRIAERRGMPVDEQMVAKFALFERCVGSAAIAKMYSLINEAPSGKPKLIADLEKLLDDHRKFSDAFPEEWKPDASFHIEWFALNPPLGDVDLRPLVYLSREVTPVRTQSAELSQSAAQAAARLCAEHAQQLGGASSLSSLMGRRPSETQGRRCEAGSEGSV